MDAKRLFWELYKAPTEEDVSTIINHYNCQQSSIYWRPYGGNESYYGAVENQQSSPIPALIEKITNGIDAILMRACHEHGIDPRSEKAPRSINEAIERFFPAHKDWDISKYRREFAERLQILAHGPRLNTSLIVYDDGEGQAPEDFEKTFLSLFHGNKNDIHFVQGRYNMGATGAIAFCGKLRYQLIASKRFDGTDELGFTLVRRHPFTADEEKQKKSTWYEYLVVNDQIPAFVCGNLKLGLHNREFTTGTVIKLYSYDLPPGSRSVISRDLNQSINEYLFKPAFPIFTIDTPDRYPDDRNLERELYGLKRRLEEDDSRYVDQFFSEDVSDSEIGQLLVTCYVFKPKTENHTVKETRETIQREFFKNNMSVLFSVDGQVHGHYTSEFITRSLKFNILRDHLLIHVDCTNLKPDFRKDLFMASRDRIKAGRESFTLRDKLSKLLSNGRLKDINKERKASITVESEDAENLLRKLTHNLPINKELSELLSQTFKLEDNRDGKRKEKSQSIDQDVSKEGSTFSPNRYPSRFNIDTKPSDEKGIPIIQLPISGERTIKFSTDVEDEYFDRIQDPGELQIGLLEYASNEGGGGNQPGQPKNIRTILNVVKSSPRKGSIRILVKPAEEVKVGDSIKLQASLTGPQSLNEIFMVRITGAEKKKSNQKKNDEPDNRLGLPDPYMAYKEDGRGNGITWKKLGDNNIHMDHDTIVYPYVDGDTLSAIYINMDSSVLLSHRAKLNRKEAIDVAERRYISAVYFHTLFLYTITKNRKYGIVRDGDEQNREESIDLTQYISDLFTVAYAQFLLNFDTQTLIDALED